MEIKSFTFNKQSFIFVNEWLSVSDGYFLGSVAIFLLKSMSGRVDGIDNAYLICEAFTKTCIGLYLMIVFCHISSLIILLTLYHYESVLT